MKIETKKTGAGCWIATCHALRLTGKGKSKDAAIRAAKKSANTLTRQIQENARIVAWIGSDEALKALGRGFVLRLEVLARRRNGRSLASIGEEYGVTIQNLSKMSRRLNHRLTASD
jgi:hypothetical protein